MSWLENKCGEEHEVGSAIWRSGRFQKLLLLTGLQYKRFATIFSNAPDVRRPSERGALTWREKLGVVRFIRQFLRLAWQAHRGYATVTVLLRLLQAFVRSPRYG